MAFLLLGSFNIPGYFMLMKQDKPHQLKHLFLNAALVYMFLKEFCSSSCDVSEPSIHFSELG